MSLEINDLRTEKYKPVQINTKIKMLISAMGSNTGLATQLYEAGKTYKVSKSLAQSFVAAEKAEYVN